MRQLKKLLERIRRQPKSVRFDEVASVLKSIGYEKRQPQSGSSPEKRVHAGNNTKARALCKGSLCENGDQGS